VGDEWCVIVEGACTFLSLPRLTRVLTSIPSGTTVTVIISVNYLDHAAHQAITEWQRQHRATGGTVRICVVVETGQLARPALVDLEPELLQAAA
jgi:carbonic anhydrase